MKKKTIAFVSMFLSAVFALSGCRENPEIPQQPISNGSFGGIAFDTSIYTAASAVPIPIVPVSSVVEQSEAENNPTQTSPAEPPISAADPVTTPTVTTTTTAAATTTTAAATTTTAAATTTAAKTTVETTTAASAATETASTDDPDENYKKNSYQALNYNEMKGVWISYLEISALLKGKTESEFRNAAGKIFDNCTSLGINTVYVHARAFGDAFYFSSLFPFTKHISGSVGKKTAYDPYPILIEEAHERGLSFHAWINPLRLCSSADMEAVSLEYPIREWYGDSSRKGTYIVNVGGTWYLNPAYDEAIRLVADGVREIVSRYDVDGIHIDDYFYPTTDASFDSAAYASSGASSLSAFRIDRCNQLVRAIYNAVHECSSAVFGASTQGNMDNNINQLYADAQAWCRDGYVDYFAPQIYYGFLNSAQPFEHCTDQWNQLVSGTDTKLCIGLAVYKVGQEDRWAGEGRYEWQNTETMLKRQIEYAKSCANYGGIALYSYNYLFTDGYVTSAIQKEKENFKPLLK